MSFWQQDAEKVIVTFPGPPSGALDDVDVVLTQNSFRASIRSTGVAICDSSLFSAIKSASAHYGIKTRHAPDGSITFSVIVYMEKANHGEQWMSLFTQTAVNDNALFPPVVAKVRTTYPYAPDDPNELAFPQDVVITVLNQDPSGWWQGYLEGKRGNFPMNFVELIDSSVAEFDVDDPNNVVYTTRAPAGGAGMGMGMGMGMPGRGRGMGMGFGAALNGELGKALKRRTMNPGASPVAAAQPQQPQMQMQPQMQPFQAQQPVQPQPQPQPEPEPQPQVQQQPQVNEMGIPIITLEPGVTQVRATADYQGSDTELAFHQGDIITVWATDPSGWWEGECNGSRGWFPANFTIGMPTPAPAPAQAQAPAPAAAEPTPAAATPAVRVSRGGSSAGRGAPAMRGRKPSGSAGSQPQQEQQSGGLPFAVNLKPRAPQAEQPKAAEEQPSGGLPFPVKLKSVSQDQKPAPAPVAAQPQPQAEESSGGGLPFPVKLRSSNSTQELQPQQPQAQPQPQQHAGAPKAPAKRAGPPRPAGPGQPHPGGQPHPQPQAQPKPQPQPQAQPKPQPQPGPKPQPQPKPAPAAAAAPAAAPGGGMKDWPSSLPDFDSFCSNVHSAVTGASVRGPQSRNMVGLPGERGSAVCSLDGHARSSGTNNAVPLAAGIVAVLYAYCRKNNCAPPAQQMANLDSTQTGIVLAATCAKGKYNAPWDVVADVTAYVNGIMRGNVGFSLPVYMKAKQASESVWSAGFELKLRRVLPEGCDVQTVMDIYFQLSSMQVTMEEGARLAAGLAKEDGVASFIANSCSLLPGKNVAVVGGESGLALAILPKVGGIAAYASELNVDATLPAIAQPAIGGLADKHADVFTC